MDISYFEPIISIFIFILGASFGSFFNVCISRIPLKKSLIPDSHCPKCNYKIQWYDNIPLLSWLLLKGKCKNCGTKIHWHYFAVELVTALGFLLLFWKFSLTWIYLKYLIFFSFSVIIFAIDSFEMIIPDVLSLPLIIIGILISFFPEMDIDWLQSILGGLFGFLFFWFIAVAFEKVTHKEGMGGGDIKYIAGIGSFLGLVGSLFTIIFSSVFFVVFVLIMDKGKTKPYPYGPFLAIASMFYVFIGEELWQWYLNFAFSLMDKLAG